MQGRPILNLHRMAAIVSVVLAHTQLVIGLILYATRFSTYGDLEGRARTFWKFEHIGTMIIAVVLITLGRSLSKRSNDQRVKQMRVAVFFLIALALMLWATPWPFTTIGHGRQWL
jgi:chromate transport protein ChrA